MKKIYFYFKYKITTWVLIFCLLFFFSELSAQQYQVIQLVSPNGFTVAFSQVGCPSNTFQATCLNGLLPGAPIGAIYNYTGGTLVYTGGSGIYQPYQPTSSIVPCPCSMTITASSNPSTISQGNYSTLNALASSGSGNYTYNWSNGLGSGSSKIVWPTATTTYTVTVTDNANTSCVRTASTTVTVTTCNLSATASSSPSTIFAGNNSTLTVSVSGGSGNYTYNWNNGLGGVPWTMVSPTSTTSYTVTVTDNSTGCVATASTTVTVTCNLSATASSSPSTIFAGSNSTLTVSASVGSGNYTYNWSNGLGSGSSKTVSPTATTTYNVTVTDNSTGCTSVGQTTVTVNTCVAPTSAGGIVASPTSVLLGYSVNSYNLSFASGGAGGTIEYYYEYSANGGASWTYISGWTSNWTSSFIPPYAGNYIIRRRARTNCGSSEVYTTTNFSAYSCPTINVFASASPSTICEGGSGTTISASASGGSGGYSYSWSGGAGSGSSVFVNPSITTTYSVTANSNGCIGTGSVTVSVISNYTSAGSITGNETNCGSFDPSAITSSASPSGGSGGTTQYQWEYSTNGGISWSIVSGETNVTYDPSTITTTTSYRRGARRSPCTGAYVYTNTVVKTVNTAPIANAGANQSIFIGGNASLNASASGGGGGYTYSWNNGLGTGAAKTVSPTTTTTYTVTVSDANGCTNTDQVTVSISGCSFTVNAGVSQTICTGANTTITATASGSGSYTYNWDNGLGTGATKTVSPTTTTTYTVTVTDGSCAVTESITLTVLDNFTSGGTIGSDESNCGSLDPANMTETAAASGGSGGTTEYIWEQSTNNGTTWTVISGANAATYDPTTITQTTLYRRGARRTPCTDYVYSNIVTKTVSSTAATSTTICSGNSISLVAPAGVSYAWSHGLGNTQTVTASPTTTTTYTVTVTDANGCSGTSQVIVTVNTNFNNGGTITANQSNCGSFDPANMTETAAASGGSGGTTEYIWEQSTNNGTTWTVISGANAATYDPMTIIQTTLYRRGARRTPCTDYVYSNIVTKTVSSTAATSTTICSGTSVTLEATGGVSYAWSNGLGNTATVTAYPTTTTTYTVTVTDANGCSGTSQVIVTVNTNFNNGGTIAANQSNCGSFDPANMTETAAASGGSGGTTEYIWEQSTNNGTTWTVISGANAATYDPMTITQTTLYRRGARRTPCTDYVYSNIVTKTVSSTEATSTTICSGTSVTLEATGGVSYSWSNGLGNTATVTAYPTTTTTYTVTVTDANGCSSTSQVIITVNTNFNNGGTITANQSNCGSFDPANMTETAAASGGSGGTTEYIWEQSTNNGTTWTVISGANAATYDPMTITQTTLYRRGARRTPCTDYVYSNTVTKTVNGSPVITNTSVSNALCGQNNGSITFTFTDNIAMTGIEFSINGGLTYPHSSPDNAGTYTISNLGSGSYDLWVRWDNGDCPMDLSVSDVVINSTGSISATTSPSQNICTTEGLQSVTISATGSGGLSPYTYTWDNGLGNAATHTVSPTVTTTYNVTVTDGNLCTAIGQVTVSVVEVPTVSFTSTNPSCAANNGTITFTFPNHGTQTGLEFSFDGGLTYQVSVPDNIGTYTYTNRAAGIYNLWVRWDNDACPIFLGRATLSNNQNLKAAVAATTYVCVGSSTTLHAVAVNGTAPYNFTWLNGVGNTASIVVSPTVTTNYTVRVIDSNGCVAFEMITLIADSCGEDCSNGIDDDGDGLIDCDDWECRPTPPSAIIRQ